MSCCRFPTALFHFIHNSRRRACSGCAALPPLPPSVSFPEFHRNHPSSRDLPSYLNHFNRVQIFSSLWGRSLLLLWLSAIHCWFMAVPSTMTHRGTKAPGKIVMSQLVLVPTSWWAGEFCNCMFLHSLSSQHDSSRNHHKLNWHNNKREESIGMQMKKKCQFSKITTHHLPFKNR